MTKEILRLKNINKYYYGTSEKLHIIRNLNLTINKGEFITILGRSGSGKSTLLNLIGLLDKVDDGDIYLDKKKVSNLNTKDINKMKNYFLGFVFQFHYLLSEFNALENVMIPALLNNYKFKNDIKEQAKNILEMVGLGDRMLHKPNQLSGGEKQRVAIARALINRPKIILADEPTGNLDEETSETIFNIFKDINKKYKQTIIVVTHSRELAKMSDRELYLKRGTFEKHVDAL